MQQLNQKLRINHTGMHQLQLFTIMNQLALHLQADIHNDEGFKFA